MEQREPDDPLGVFVGLRNVMVFYVVVIVLAWAIASFACCAEPCDHPVDMQRIDIEFYEQLSTGEVIVCELCGRELAVDMPGVYYYNSHKPGYAERLAEHKRYVSQVRESIDARKAANIQTRIKTMKNGVGYTHPDRQSPAGSKDYIGATSSGDGWEIRWAGPYNKGPQAIDVLRAALDHLTHLQRTTSTSEANAKLIVHVTQAIEEYDGASPSIGGSLNDLIPKAEDAGE